MGNGCSVFKIKKICLDGDLNIVAGKGDSQSQSDNINILELNNKKNNNLNSIQKKSSISSNGIKYKTGQNNPGQEPNHSNSSPNNQSPQNSKIESNEINNPKSNFTNFMQELDISFNNNNNKNAQNQVFDINYIKIKNEYNQEIIDYLNKIRNEPSSIIMDIENLLGKITNNSGNKKKIESDETHENIILDDGGKALSETKNYLNEISPVKEKFNLNEDLIIDIHDSDKNLDIPLDKKVTKILMGKRNNIIDKYPKCQFFINFIKDKKMSVLFLLSQNENKSNFRNIIFDDKYRHFNVTWMKDKKKIFLAFLCFA